MPNFNFNVFQCLRSLTEYYLERVKQEKDYSGRENGRTNTDNTEVRLHLYPYP